MSLGRAMTSSCHFFVNEREALESRDFKDMVYDENQCIGTLFGLTSSFFGRKQNPPFGDPSSYRMASLEYIAIIRICTNATTIQSIRSCDKTEVRVKLKHPSLPHPRLDPSPWYYPCPTHCHEPALSLCEGGRRILRRGV